MSSSLTDLISTLLNLGGGNAIPVSNAVPVAANILNGTLDLTASGGPTTILTVPAGRTWKGTVYVSCSISVAGGSATNGSAAGFLSTSGAGAVPSGTFAGISCKAGANVATGTAGSEGGNFGAFDCVIVAPPGNSVSLQGSATVVGTQGEVYFSAIGALQ